MKKTGISQIQRNGETKERKLELIKVTTEKKEEAMSCAPCGIFPCICSPGKVHM